jgi:hypothetical protein
MKTTKKIWYVNYLGKWTESPLKATKKNLKQVKKTVAENGRAAIFQTSNGKIKASDTLKFLS